jgi:hypothetical protein
MVSRYWNGKPRPVPGDLEFKLQQDTLKGRQEPKAITSYSDCACCGRYTWASGYGGKSEVCAESCGGQRKSQVGDDGTYPHLFEERWCRRGFK